MKYDVLFRLDAGEGIGLGHLRRCLALADAFKAKGIKRIAFATRTDKVLEYWLKKKFPIFKISSGTLNDELGEWRSLACVHEIAIAIVDRYDITVDFLAGIKTHIPTVLCIDDTARLDFYPVDGVINHNPYAKALKYRTNPEARLFLGTEYALIGEEFLAYRYKKNMRKKDRTKFFVSLGGFGAAESCFLKIERALQKLNGKIETFWARGSAQETAREMASSDLALSGSGITSYELAFLGIPTALVILGDSQEKTAETLGRKKIVKNLGWLEKLSSEQIGQKLMELMNNKRERQMMGKRARTLIDGKGAFRLANALIKTYLARKSGQRMRRVHDLRTTS